MSLNYEHFYRYPTCPMPLTELREGGSQQCGNSMEIIMDNLISDYLTAQEDRLGWR